MSKFLILGGRSFLGNHFKKFLETKFESNLVFTDINTNRYSRSNIEKKIYEYKPEKLIDFKFPKVSSNDKDFPIIKSKDNFFKPQINLIKVINEMKTPVEKILLISTAGNRQNLYTQLKREQEVIYKNNLINKSILSILRLNTVFGPGDLNFSRIIPFYFQSILQSKKVEFNINGNKKGKFIYIDDAMDLIYKESNRLTFDDRSFVVSYKNLIETLMHVVFNDFNYVHKVSWNNSNLDPNIRFKNETILDNLRKTAEWYYKNLYR